MRYVSLAIYFVVILLFVILFLSRLYRRNYFDVIVFPLEFACKDKNIILIGKNIFYSANLKSLAGCLHQGQMKSSGREAPS